MKVIILVLLNKSLVSFEECHVQAMAGWDNSRDVTHHLSYVSLLNSEHTVLMLHTQLDQDNSSSY